MRTPSTWGFAATLVVALSSCPYFPEDFIDDTDAGTGGAGGDGGSGGTGGDGGGGGGGSPGGNLAPTFDVIPDVTVAEDNGRVTVAVSSLSAGDSSEDAFQTVTVTAVSDNEALLGTSTLGGSAAAPTFSWQPAANGVGAGTITVTATDSLGATFSRTFTITVTPVNDAPTLETPTSRVVSSPATLTIPLVTGPGGGADEASQTVTVTASANPPTLFASMTASATQLVLVPASTGHGIATLTLTANDGQAANNTRQVSFQVMVNQSPPDITVLAPPGGTLSSCVTLTYAVRDSLSLPAALKLEVDDGTGWRPGTLRASEATNVTTSPAGLVHTVTWRSGSDTASGSVNVRLSAVRGEFAGMSATAMGLTVANGPKFSPAAHFQGGPGTFQAVAVDLNGDGRFDVATPDSFSTSVSVMRGLTDGGFEAPIAYPTTSAMCAGREPKPFSLNVADFNGDGHRDIFVVHENCDTAAVLLSARDGGYLPYQTVATGINPLFASVADFNLDGKADVAVVNYISNDVSVLLGTGDGGFLPQTRFSTGVNPNKIETADFNGDGRPDVVTADATDDRVSILYGDTDGGLRQRTAFDAGLGVRNLAVGDLNGDGLVDIVGANSGQDNLGSTCAVLYATDAGSFAAPVTYPTQVHPRSAAVGDVNGDGKPDFAIGNVNSDSVSVFLSRGNKSFHPAAHLSVGPGPHSVQFVDLNGDGKPEILTGNTGNATFSVLSNQTAVCAP